MPNQKSTDAALAAGRLAYERHAWGEAYESLSAADIAGDLEAEDLERLAISAYLTGRPEQSTAIGARAHLRAVQNGEVELAIRGAISLGMSLIQRNEVAQAGGWFARAARLIEETDYDGSERGRLLVMEALRSQMSGDPATAFAIYEEVAAIADRFGDRDLAALGRLGRGESLIAMDDVQRGVPLLDEAMTAVIAGEISPIVSGIIYCTVIQTCQQLYDLRRAQEWTSALTRWLESQPDLVPFRGNCLVYRAELMRLHGAWQDAGVEAERAREWLSRPPPEPEVGQAIYQLAELDRLRGAFESAEIDYREAGTWGRLPEPGHALLRLAQGDVGAASTAIRRALAEAVDDLDRSRLLEPAAEIALAAGDVTTARESADRLAAMAARADAPLLRAMALRAEGAVLLAEGDVEAALNVLRRAWEAWARARCPVRRRTGPGPDRGRLPNARRRRWGGARSGLCPRRVHTTGGGAGSGPARRRHGCRSGRRGARRPQHARGRGPAAGCGRFDQPRDRRRPDDQRTNRRQARQQHLHQARRVHPRRGHRLRLRARLHLTEVPIRSLVRIG